jgi:hypothetical protein
LVIVEQSLPGDVPQSEEQAERKGLPDIVIHDDAAWCLLIESKVPGQWLNLKDSSMPPVVLELLLDERLITTPERRPIQILSPDCPVEHVAKQREVPVDRGRPPNSERLLVLCQARRFLQLGDEVLDVRGPDVRKPFLSEVNPCGEKSLPRTSITTIMRSIGVLLPAPGGSLVVPSQQLPPSTYWTLGRVVVGERPRVSADRWRLENR